MRRLRLRLPSGGSLAVHYKKARVNAGRCAKCGRMLLGVPMKNPSELSRLSLSEKRPERMLGGQLCHICLKESLKRAVRSAVPA